MPKKKADKVVDYVFWKFFNHNSTGRVTNCLYSMAERAVEEGNEGVEKRITSMVTDFSPLSQPSPYRSAHPHLSCSKPRSPINQDLTRFTGHNEGSKPTSDQRYDDECLDISSVPVADVEVPSGPCENISVIDSLSTFSAMDRPACKNSDPKSNESSSANHTCATPFSHCELFHTSQGNGAKDSTLEVSEPSNTVISKTSKLQVDSHDEQISGSTSEETPRLPNKNLPSPATSEIRSPVASISPPFKKRNTRARRSIVSTNHQYISDYNSIDVSIFDKSDDSTYIEPTASNRNPPQGTKRTITQRKVPTSFKKQKKTCSSSPSVSSAHQSVPPPPHINNNSPVSSAKASTPRSNTKPPSRRIQKYQAKKHKKRSKKLKTTHEIKLPRHSDLRRLNHIKICAVKHLPSNKPACNNNEVLFSSDDEENEVSHPNEIPDDIDPGQLPWYGKGGVAKIACSLTPLQLGKFRIPHAFIPSL